jgi:hypothetical protein
MLQPNLSPKCSMLQISFISEVHSIATGGNKRSQHLKFRSSLLIISKDDVVVAIRLLYLRDFLQNFSKSILVLQCNHN